MVYLFFYISDHKIILIFKLPLLDDEAYFITWGQSLEGGYYDHPPLIGWITWLLSFVSKSQEFQRFFPLLTIGLLSTSCTGYIEHLTSKKPSA